MAVARSKPCEHLNCLSERLRYLKSIIERFWMKSPIPVKSNIGGRRTVAFDAFISLDATRAVAGFARRASCGDSLRGNYSTAPGSSNSQPTAQSIGLASTFLTLRSLVLLCEFREFRRSRSTMPVRIGKAHSRRWF
jgi:hypothetical protein